MNKFQNFMLASDIDNTFICGPIVPERNLEAVRYFNENGGRFSFASGRNHLDFRLAVPGDPATFASMPYVLCNGSFLYDAKTDAILNPHYVDPVAAKALYLDIAEKYPDFGIRGSAEIGFVVLESDIYIRESLTKNGSGSLIHAYSPENLCTDRLFKVVITKNNQAEKLTEIGEYIKTHYDAFTVTRSTPAILEIQPKGISKAYQLDYLRNEYRKQNPDIQLWCIGDYDNDIEMLQIADVALCPENASDNVKAICDHVVCHCRDGAIADAVAWMERSL